MTHFRAALTALLLLASFSAAPAVPVDSQQIIPSPDGKLYSAFPDGDGPDDPGTTCDVPTGWACANAGSGTGTIDKQSDTEWDFDVIGNSATQANVFAYKDAGSGDVQLICRVTDDYTGATGNFAGFGCGLREGTGTDDWQILGFSPQSASYAVRVLYGSAGTYTGATGSAGQTRPQCIAYTYDVSQTDLRVHESDDCSTYTQVVQVSRDMADVIAFATGQSGSPTVSLQGTIDQIALGSSITVYTPEDPPESNDPVCTTIPGQSWTQDIAVSFSVASFCSDPNGDALTFSASGFPGGTGLSINTAGTISGVPTSSDVGVRNIEITATDPSSNEGHATFQATVTSPPEGDVFTIPTSNSSRTFRCNVAGDWSGLGGTGTPGPGDTIRLANGVHGGTGTPLRFQNCSGSASSPLRIVNQTSGGGPAIIRKTGGSSGSFVFRLSNVNHIEIDGTGKWSGAGSDGCGMAASWPTPPSSPQCGIVVSATNGSISTPSSWIKFDNFSCTEGGCTVKGVEIDGIDHTPSQGIGISLDDAAEAYSRANNPGVYRHDVLITDNYIHDTGASALYLGPNWSEGNIPLKDIEQSYNYMHDLGRRCVSTKSSVAGTNTIHHNYCDTSGIGNDFNGFGHCATFHDGYGDFYNNILKNCQQTGISWTISAGVPESFGPHAVSAWNNIIDTTGTGTLGGGHAINVIRPSASTLLPSPLTIFNNTVVDSGGNCVNVDSTVTGSKVARDNICAGASTQSRAVNGITDTNNLKGTEASMNFTGGYELSSTSPACNSASNQTLNNDYEGESRPQDGANDQGADEAAACP